MKKTTIFIVVVLSIFLSGLYMVASTYSVIVEVIDNDGVKEIVNEMYIKDFLIDDRGNYNDLYYDLKSEILATDEEINLLMNSKSLNELLRSALKSVVDYRLNDDVDAKYSPDELYNLISDAVIKDNNFSDDLKSRVINKVSKYRNDIIDYVYDIDISLIGK